MWPFGTKNQPELTHSARFEALEAKVRALDDIQEKHGRQLKTIELDCEEWYEKLKHLMARVTKRAKVDTPSADDSSAAPEAPGRVNGNGQGLSPLGSHETLKNARRRHGFG